LSFCKIEQVVPLDRKTLEKIYFTFVRPLIEYADVIWDNMSISLNKKIENVQLSAVSFGSSTIRYKLVSSANSFIVDCISVTMSLINNGSLEKHIDMITGKANKRINILRKFKFILDRKTLEKIYFTFVRPLLEYRCLCSETVEMSLLSM
jgi:hypothetical protein